MVVTQSLGTGDCLPERETIASEVKMGRAVVHKVASFFLVMAVFVACGDTQSESQSQSEPSISPTAEPECVQVGAPLRGAIEMEVAETSGASLEGPMLSVPSQKVEGVWFVAAEINGAAAVWAVNYDPQIDSSGLIFVANNTARQYSEWGSAASPDSPAAKAMALDDTEGIRRAEACLGR